MRAKALVPILAEIFGVPSETAFVIDRGLAEGGYRAKGKGRAWPEMSRREAIYFLIACMTSTTSKGKVAARAAEDVRIWETAITTVKARWETYALHDDDDEEISAEELIAASGEDLEPEDLACGGRLVDRTALLPFLDRLHGQDISLIDYLLEIMHWLATAPKSGEDIIFSLSPSHLEASIRVHKSHDKWDKETFWVAGDPTLGPDFDQPAIRTDISVSGDFLAAIAIRTADPLAEATD